MYMHMIFTYHTFQDYNFIHLTNLDDQLPASLLYISFEYMVTIFRRPNYVTRQPGYRMRTLPHSLFHAANIAAALDFSKY